MFLRMFEESFLLVVITSLMNLEKPYSLYETPGFLLSTIYLLGYLVIVAYLFIYAYKITPTQAEKEKIFQVMFDGVRTDDTFSRLWFPINCVRKIFYVFAIFHCYRAPIGTILLQTYLSLATMILLVRVNPLRNSIDNKL